MYCFFSANNVPLSLIVGQVIGYFAALLGIITCLPQLIKTLKTRNTANISLATYCLFNLANLL
ncbi:PQ-loop domain-containing transporter [Spiroplasma sp. DGKH1]|uniref:PQ-loop domain-containing transporter n=1 Tax=Spiroplasma sp. DGKH1 TaxID=3050074 RepID=UPI0034C6944F